MRERERPAARQELERRLVPFAAAGARLTREEGWTRTVRRALGVTAGAMAERLGTTRRAVQRLEAAEAAGRLELCRLRELAEALGCEVRYALRPTKPLEELAQKARWARKAAQRKRRGDTRTGLEILRDEARRVLQKLLG